MTSSQAPRIVLDTNVCLDLFVFDDPCVARLHEALRTGAVVAWWTMLPCRVAAGPCLSAAELDAAPRAKRRIERFDGQRCIGSPPRPRRPPRRVCRAARIPTIRSSSNSRCASGARWLLSRDDHLLALDRRTQSRGRFGILTPQAWTRRIRHGHSASTLAGQVSDHQTRIGTRTSPGTARCRAGRRRPGTGRARGSRRRQSPRRTNRRAHRRRTGTKAARVPSDNGSGSPGCAGRRPGWFRRLHRFAIGRHAIGLAAPLHPGRSLPGARAVPACR